MTSSLNNHKPYAVVIGLDCFTGLQTVRILANHKIPVIGIAKDPKHCCCRTKVCERQVHVDINSVALIDALEELGPSLSAKAVLFPCTDTSVSLISKHRQRLFKWYHVALPDADVVDMLMDKVRFTKYAQKEGLPIPKTFFLQSREDAEEAAKKMNYPCILKPPRKTSEWEANSKDKVFKVEDKQELLSLYDRYSRWAEVLMAQEWIEGSDDDLYSCNCYFNKDSEPVATFVARKLRQWPPEAGTSCLGEECVNDSVLETTVRLFKDVQYKGLGYLEMKQNAKTKKHVIIEPNIGRPTGRSAIAEAGGVELLYAKYCDLVGLPLPPNLEQKYSGVKWIYLRRDIQSAWYYWKRGDLTIRGWWKSIKGKKAYALFSWKDPVPFWADLAKVAIQFPKKLEKK